MSRPYFFTWVDEPVLAALAWPEAAEQLSWLRAEGVDVLITLTEEPLPRAWVDSAGLLGVHVPIEDFGTPSEAQIEQVINTIEKAKTAGMGVAVHCMAGQGRTGTVLAAYFVSQGMTAKDAIKKVRELRPGSIENAEQEDVVREFERARKRT